MEARFVTTNNTLPIDSDLHATAKEIRDVLQKRNIHVSIRAVPNPHGVPAIIVRCLPGDSDAIKHIVRDWQCLEWNEPLRGYYPNFLLQFSL